MNIEELNNVDLTPDISGSHVEEETGLADLAEQMNTGVAWYSKAKSLSEPVDTSVYQDTAFNYDNLKAESAKIEDLWVREQMTHAAINSWESFEKNKRYLQEQKAQRQAVAAKYSPVEMLAYGLPMAVIDVDSVFINPTIKAGNLVKKSLSLQSRLSKNLVNTAVGGAVGAESMLAYEATTGIYEEDSVTNAALMGMALGGGLGAFMERSNKTSEIYSDVDGKIVDDITPIRGEELAKAEAELSEIEKAIEIHGSLKASRKAKKEAIKAGEKADKASAKSTLVEMKEQLGMAVETASAKVTESVEALKNLTTSKKTLIKTNKETRKALTTLQKERDVSFKANDDIKFIKRSVTKLEQEKSRLVSIIGQSAKYGAKHADAIAKKYEAKIGKIEKEIAKGATEIAKIEKKITWTPEKDALIRDTNNAYIATAEVLHNSSKEIRKAEKTIESAKAEKKARQAEHKQWNTVPENVKDSEYTAKQRERLARTEELLTDEGFAKLIEERGMLQGKLDDVKAGDITMFGYRRNHINIIDKLTKELEDANKAATSLADFKKTGQFKAIPKWMQKFVISPIENLLTSNNEAVRGLASMLHTGTLSRGAMNQHTASNVKKRLNAKLNETHRNIREAYKEAVRTGETTKKFEDWETDVAIEANAVIGKMQRTATEGIDGGLQGEARLEKIRENLAASERVYRGNTPSLNKGVDEILNYYEATHKYGKDLGMDSFQGVGKGYLPRHYDAQRITQIGREEAINRIVEAQVTFATHHNKIVDDAMRAEFKAKAEHAVDSSLDHTAKLNTITKPYGKVREKTSTSRLSERTIEAFDDDLADVLEMDIMGSSSIYALSVHGRLALMEKLGVQSLEEIETIIQRVEANPKDTDNLRVVIDTILGVREMTKNPFSVQNQAISAVSGYSSMMHTMGFGVPTLTEFFSISKEFGFTNTLKQLVPSVKQVHALYKHGTTSDINQIGAIAEFGTALMGHKANRLDIGDNIVSYNRAQEFMDGVTRKESIWGGLMPITDTLKLMSIAAGTDFLAKATVRKLSKTDVARLEDMGFTLDDLPKLREVLKVDKDGKIGNMDRATWGEYQDKISDGLVTLIDRTILHPDGATLPKFMTDVNEGAFVSKIIMKFMRFPMESIERLGLRGMQQADAKQGTALMGNIALWATILMAKDAMLEDDKQKYDLSTDEGLTHLMKDSFMANSWTGGMTSMADRVSSVATGDNIFSDYQGNVVGAGIGDVKKLLWRRDPTLNIYGHNLHIGDAVGDTFNAVGLLDEVAKED